MQNTENKTTEKRPYVKPEIQVIELNETPQLLASSNGVPTAGDGTWGG